MMTPSLGWSRRLLATACCLLAVRLSAQILDTTADAWLQLGTFGLPDTAVYGQTFRAPAGYAGIASFQIDASLSGSAAVEFQAYLSVWSEAANRAEGSPLWTSGGISVVSSGAVSSFAFDLGNLPLAQLTDYVFFIRALSAGSAYLPASIFNPYPSGRFVFQNNTGDFSRHNTAGWDAWWGLDGDLGFRAVFTNSAPISPVPEASSLAAGGVLACALMMARRRLGRLAGR